MKLEYTITRDEATIGTDAVPVDDTYLANDNVWRCPNYGPAPDALEAVAVAYAAPEGAPDAVVDLYYWDELTEEWYRFADTTVPMGEVRYPALPNIVERMDSRTWSTIHVAVVVRAMVDPPEGDYEITVAASIGYQGVDLGGTLAGVIAVLASILSESGTIRSTTTPDKADGEEGKIEVDRTGNTFGSIVLAHDRPMILPVAGSITDTTELYEGPCDGLICETDDVYVYVQLRESPRLASIDPADWTLGGGWTAVGSVITHTPGSTNDLVFPQQATFPILAGLTYCVMYTVAGRTQGQVTEKLGTAAGSARTTNETFLIAITAATNGNVVFTPDSDFDGSIDIQDVWIFPHVYLANAGERYEYASSHVAALADMGSPTILVATPDDAVLKAVWYRRPGAEEV